MTKENLLKAIDNFVGWEEKLEFLNGQFLKAKTKEQEDMILEMIEQLKEWGR